MTYRETLAACSDANIGRAVATSLDRLFERDKALLTINVAEQTVAACLARYLQDHFPQHHVDVEYNRMGDAPKRVTWSDKLEEVYPDIIIHRRGTASNLLAIELKKNSNPETSDRDLLKLAAYRRELGYLHALFLRLGVENGAGTVSECQWVNP